MEHIIRDDVFQSSDSVTALPVKIRMFFSHNFSSPQTLGTYNSKSSLAST